MTSQANLFAYICNVHLCICLNLIIFFLLFFFGSQPLAVDADTSFWTLSSCRIHVKIHNSSKRRTSGLKPTERVGLGAALCLIAAAHKLLAGNKT